MKNFILHLFLLFVVLSFVFCPLYIPYFMDMYREYSLLKAINNNPVWVDKTAEKCCPSDSFVLTINTERE